MVIRHKLLHWPSGFQGRHKFIERFCESGFSKFDCICQIFFDRHGDIQGLWIFHESYRVKPHDQLVLVSSMHYCAYTPTYQRPGLDGSFRAKAPGSLILRQSFPLRCFQRLSLPNLATRQCHWRDNRYTRGSSTPVPRTREQPPQIFQRPRKMGTKLSHDVLNPARVPL